MLDLVQELVQGLAEVLEKGWGLAMVAHQDQLILLGGFTAMNKPGEDHDLRSQTAVRAFDTSTQEWSELPTLPAGRSSHDAAILDGVMEP